MLTHNLYFKCNEGQIGVCISTGALKELADNVEMKIVINIGCNGNCAEIFM
jgi:hypothetical protein